jgi:predicted ABC-type exoprotein transport system permease subunit
MPKLNRNELIARKESLTNLNETLFAMSASLTEIENISTTQKKRLSVNLLNLTNYIKSQLTLLEVSLAKAVRNNEKKQILKRLSLLSVEELEKLQSSEV